MTAIKICGIKNEEQALAVAEAGADFIGLMFADSPRRVTPAQAEKIVAALKKSRARVKAVGVFVNISASTVNKIADLCQLDWIQLSGDETWEDCLELTRPIIKAIKLSDSEPAESVVRNLQKGEKVLGKQKHIFLLDTVVKGQYGGTGITFDWNLARPIAERFPVIIAGGLTPENVGKAIKIIKPWGVDVSTGVETKGVKDMKKVVKFIKAVKEADKAYDKG